MELLELNRVPATPQRLMLVLEELLQALDLEDWVGSGVALEQLQEAIVVLAVAAAVLEYLDVVAVARNNEIISLKNF